MKKIIAAVILAAIPASLYAAIPQDNETITDAEVAGRARICMSLADKSITAEQVINALRLDTIRKQRDFALQCRMFFVGAEVGQRVSQRNMI